MDYEEYLGELKRRYIVLGKEKNLNGETFFVCAMKDKDEYTMITLKDIERKQPPSTLNIIIESYKEDTSKKIIKIGDIITPEKNNGNGSILMKYLFQYASEKKNIEKVIGEISEIDKNHFDRLEHFYKKHGFKVIFYTNEEGERIGGYIEKDL
jgi:hypothetical protein